MGGFLPWERLPKEIRLMILEQFLSLSEIEGFSVASAAAVCQEWQPVIEKHTFRSLHLSFQDPATRYHICRLPKRSESIRHLNFGIFLREYGYKEVVNACKYTSRNWTLERADAIQIEFSLRHMFTILRRIKPNRRKQLEVDLTVESPSDPIHHFGCDCGQSMELYDLERNWEWADDVQARPTPPPWAVRKLFDYIYVPSELWSQHPPLKAPAVTKLTLRRQTRRRWPWEGALEEIIRRFPNLEELHWEYWPFMIKIGQSASKGVDLGFFSRMKRVTIFQDFREDIHEAIRLFFPHDDDDVFNNARSAPPGGSMAFAKASYNLESFAGSFVVDAKDFLPTSVSVWPNLTSLALTSGLLVPCPEDDDHDEYIKEINKMFERAAGAALRMPCLQVMELWNGKKGVAGCFRFRVSTRAGYRRVGTISWTGTWELAFGERIIRCWQEVSWGLDAFFELGTTKPLKEDSIKSHADAIIQLQLENQVIHPISLAEIQEETSWNEDSAYIRG
ncbi:hypothetical protein B0T21DRAFT_414669 [Apiosordaria backusii]|uniref:DUF6546 domain-containing protein n=1 Tax=Apiosordaria backusii TaxID=314023 RepID=A0AA40E3R7_9PEZI|nr:hypothetical protein B0T21DRAFT_414669 [Apiosordaria backusii]